MARKPVSERQVKAKFAVDLPVDLVEKIDVFHRERGVFKNTIVETALRRFLLNEEEK